MRSFRYTKNRQAFKVDITLRTPKTMTKVSLENV